MKQNLTLLLLSHLKLITDKQLLKAILLLLLLLLIIITKYASVGIVSIEIVLLQVLMWHLRSWLLRHRIWARLLLLKEHHIWIREQDLSRWWRVELLGYGIRWCFHLE